MLKRDLGHLGCPFYEEKLDNKVTLVFIPKKNALRSATIYIGQGGFVHAKEIASSKIPFGTAYYLMNMILSSKVKEDFKEKVNADLANNIGNLLNRTLNMLVKYFDGEIKHEFIAENSEIDKAGYEAAENVKKCFDGYDVAEAAVKIVDFANTVNKYVADKAPWSLAKEGKMEECGQILYDVLEASRKIAVMLYPYCPNISAEIFSQLSLENKVKYDELAQNKLETGKITEKEKIHPVFPRMDSEFATDKKKAK